MTRLQTVLLLHGEPGAGKDAIAKILVERHGFVRYAFADRLKTMCEALDPVVGSKLNGTPLRLTDVIDQYGWEIAKRHYPEVRRTQQRLATEVIREFVSPTYWAEVVRDQARSAFPAPVVVSDLRFESEVEVMSWLDDVRLWWVFRTDNPLRIDDDNAGHVSEAWHPAEGSYERVDNDGTLTDLAATVDQLLKAQVLRKAAELARKG